MHRHLRNLWIVLFSLLTATSLYSQTTTPTEYLWYEAENMRGFSTGKLGEPLLNPSYLNLSRAKAPGWGINGPGVSAEWTQGGESEWNSAAASADETRATLFQDLEIPRGGEYKLWVRYADWAKRTENFTITIAQDGAEVFRHEFGAKDVIDPHDEVSLYWGWAFAWDGANVTLKKGPARVSIVIDKAAEARRHAIVGGIVFIALALWALKHPAPLGPSVAEAGADYLPRPGAQFLWLYQSLKYIPGVLGSIVGVVLPGIVLAVLVGLPWLKRPRLIAGSLLGVGVVLVILMTTVSYVSDRRDPRTAQQFSRQAAQEEAWRREPFRPALITLAPTSTVSGASGGPPEMYTKFCANCHGPHGEGAQQGRLRFPPLLDVSSKPRRSVADIMGLLKDPAAYGLQPPMRPFTDKLTKDQMREIAEWIVKLKR